ncbi:GID complex subunit containing RING finger motif [Blyttiomyces sp. JEL0837]|nr:GID complex subunit containing RING finger motif [Blyttiomyces sp. JEL0837]
MEAKRINTDGLIALEQPLIKVPLEQFKKSFKSSQKNLEKDIGSVNTGIDSMIGKIKEGTATETDAIKSLDGILLKLNNLKRKLEDTKKEESHFLGRTRARFDHLNELSSILSAESHAYVRWSKVRLDRILVDYMLRQGFFASAEKIAVESKIEHLVDIELFSQSQRIEEALRQESCAECLKWCKENSSGLKKIKSNLEFNLRLQEYVELIRDRKLQEAIQYLRKWLTPNADVHIKEIQTASALLAFDVSTSCQRYKSLFSATRWLDLIDQFRRENCTLNNLASQPLIRTSLQAGLAALKTPMCYQPDNQNVNCPVCQTDIYGTLAVKLPNAHHPNSCLVCRWSGQLMNEDNPPMVLPNGYVYSFKALEEKAARNDGIIYCERSDTQYHISQVRKAFIS